MPKGKIHLRSDLVTGRHTTFTVFCNGANCGQLCMTEEEAQFFHQVVMMSTYSKPGEIISSGIWESK